jgi:hypothetical protein
VIKKLTSPADLIDPLEFLRNFLEKTMDATKLSASQEAALKYLTETETLKNDPEAQAVASLLQEKKYGHSLPTAFDTKI